MKEVLFLKIFFMCFWCLVIFYAPETISNFAKHTWWMFWVYRPSKLYNKQYTALYNVAMECWSIGGKIINWHYKVCINKEEGATGLSSSKSLATGKSDTYTVHTVYLYITIYLCISIMWPLWSAETHHCVHGPWRCTLSASTTLMHLAIHIHSRQHTVRDDSTATSSPHRHCLAP